MPQVGPRGVRSRWDYERSNQIERLDYVPTESCRRLAGALLAIHPEERGGISQELLDRVLVSAFHDIEVTQDRDGVGAVVMNLSDDAYRFGRYRAGQIFSTTTNPVVFANAISATVGQVVRVAMAYDSNSNGSTTDTLGADIDLRVKRSDTGAIVCSSSSVQNAWEQCSFTAPVTGTYTIEVNRFSFETGWPGTYYGVAWTTQFKPNFCSGATTLTVPAGGVNVAVNTATGSTYFDAYPGYAPALTGREKVYRVNLTSTRNIVVTDNNANLDLCVLQIANCAADPFTPTVVRSVEILPLGVRAANAVVAAVSYAIQAVFPRDLAVFYPHPEGGLAPWQVLGSVLTLAAVTGLAVARARAAPLLAFGWAWFLGTLVPVIGLVQVGGQSMADRYTYVPLTVGLFVGAAWGARALVRGEDAVRRMLAPAVAAGILACMALTWRQSGYWRDSVTL